MAYFSLDNVGSSMVAQHKWLLCSKAEYVRAANCPKLAYAFMMLADPFSA